MQLVADTKKNEALIETTIRSDSVRRERSLHMLRILRDGERLESADSLAALSRMAPNAPMLISATYDAMIATGEIRLLQDGELRATILSMGAELQKVQQRLSANAEMQQSYAEQRTRQLLRHVKPSSATGGGNASDPLDIGWWTRVDFDKMRNDADAIAPFQGSVYSYNNSLGNMRSLLPSLVDFRAKIEAYLAR